MSLRPIDGETPCLFQLYNGHHQLIAILMQKDIHHKGNRYRTNMEQHDLLTVHLDKTVFDLSLKFIINLIASIDNIIFL